jgi:hypothetical protein
MPTLNSKSVDRTILAQLAGSIDPDDPIPMYHQIASVVRLAVAAGDLPIGAGLPSVRAAAGALAVNYHTIRHAWEALAEEGVISVRRGRGARVVRAPRQRGGWAAAPGGAAQASLPVAWLATGSLRGAATHADQLAASWQVVATGWPLGALPPPPGTILIADGPAPWIGREADTHVVGVVLDRNALNQVRRATEVLGTKRVLVIGDPSVTAGEILRQLPRVGIQSSTWDGPDFPPEGHRDGLLVLVLPGGSAGIPDDARTDPRVLILEPELAPGPLARVAAAAGWLPRGKTNGPPS